MPRVRVLACALFLAFFLPCLDAGAETNALDELDELRMLDARLSERIQQARESVARAARAARDIPDTRKLIAEAGAAIEALRPEHCRRVGEAVEVMVTRYGEVERDVEALTAQVKQLDKTSRALETEADRQAVLQGHAEVERRHGGIRAKVAQTQADFEAYEGAQREADAAFLEAADAAIGALEQRLARVRGAWTTFEKQRRAANTRRMDVHALVREMGVVRGRIVDAELSPVHRREVAVMMTAAGNASGALPDLPSLASGSRYVPHEVEGARGKLERVARSLVAKRCVKDIGWATRARYLGRHADDAFESATTARDRARRWHAWNGRSPTEVLEDIRAGRGKGRFKYLLTAPMYQHKYIFVDPYGRVVEFTSGMRGPRPFDEAQWFGGAQRIESKPATGRWTRLVKWKRKEGKPPRFNQYFD